MLKTNAAAGMLSGKGCHGEIGPRKTILLVHTVTADGFSGNAVARVHFRCTGEICVLVENTEFAKK